MNKVNRRNFIKQGGTAAAGFLIMPSLLTRKAPSDIVRIAHIGLGGMGNSHMDWFAKLPDAEIVALCDLDKTFV